MKKPLVIANWKAFIENPERALTLMRGIVAKRGSQPAASVVLCPPAPLLALMRTSYRGNRVLFGAQDVSLCGIGAATGEVPAALIRAAGATHVLVGHAERRARGEDDTIVAEKARIVLDAKLTPVICIGEQERDQSAMYLTVLETMLCASLAKIEPREFKKIVIAYEPVWAIGAPVAPSARVVAEALLFVRKILVQRFGREHAMQARLIYGGAVEAVSAEVLIREGGAEGFLVGRASTDASEFVGIIRACESKPLRQSRST